jgi:hypothetical protein
VSAAWARGTIVAAIARNNGVNVSEVFTGGAPLGQSKPASVVGVPGLFSAQKKAAELSGFKTDSQCRALEISRGKSGESGSVLTAALVDATN